MKRLILALLLTACASVPRNPEYDGQVAREVARCQPGPCWEMQAINNNYYEARVYVNGVRVAILPGNMLKSVPVLVTRAALDGAGCFVVYVKLWPDTKTAYSERGCPNSRSRLELSVEDSYGGHPLHVWVQDWAR